MRRLPPSIVVLLVVVGGCAARPGGSAGDATASPQPVVRSAEASSPARATDSMHQVAAAELTIAVANGTTLPVTVVVNGTTIRTIPPAGSEEGIPASALPALPWRVEARSPSGRVLASYTVNEGDVMVGPDSSRSVGNRADLSCGRLDIWSGAPMLGPEPGPGTPGDCEP